MARERNAPAQAEGQSPVVAFLASPATHGDSDVVEVLETHISRIFLVGDRAFKMKHVKKRWHSRHRVRRACIRVCGASRV